MGNINLTPFKKFEINVWNGFFENVSNTALVELKNEFGKHENTKYYQGIMYFRQDAIKNGDFETYKQQGNFMTNNLLHVLNPGKLQLAFLINKIPNRINFVYVWDQIEKIMIHDQMNPSSRLNF